MGEAKNIYFTCLKNTQDFCYLLEEDKERK